MLLLALAAVSAPGAFAGDWGRYGGNDQLTNDVPAADAPAGFAPDTLKAGMTAVWRAAVGGAIVASPLYAENVRTGTLVRTVRVKTTVRVRVHGRPVRRIVWKTKKIEVPQTTSFVYVATEDGEVDAVDVASGHVIWKDLLGTADRCGTYGVSSTGVIDRAGGVLYVVDAQGKLHALGLATGTEAAGFPVSLGLPNPNDHVWSGLTLAHGLLYVPVGDMCEPPGGDPQADGALLTVDLAKHAVVGRWDVVPGPDNLGSIWGYGGVSVDPLTGHLWTATGNSMTPSTASETLGDAEAVVELSAGAAPAPLAANRPPGIPTEETDTDFGGTPVLFQPHGCPPLAAVHSKDGNLYVFDRTNLDAGAVKTWAIGSQALSDPFIAEPSWSDDTQTLYVGNAAVYHDDPFRMEEGVAAFTIGPGCSFPSGPTWMTDVGAGTKPPPLVVGNLVFQPGGIGNDLSVLDATTGALLWRTGLPDAMLVPPILAGDRVIVAGAVSGSVWAFALTP